MSKNNYKKHWNSLLIWLIPYSIPGMFVQASATVNQLLVTYLLRNVQKYNADIVQFLQYINEPTTQKPLMHDKCGKMCVNPGASSALNLRGLGLMHILSNVTGKMIMRGKQQLSPKLVQNMQIILCFSPLFPHR